MRDHRTILLLLLVVGILLPVAVSLAQEGGAPLPAEEYLLVVGDRIKILVEGHDKELRDEGMPDQYVVPAEGEVAFPHIGRIELLDKSLKTISEEIRQKLAEKDIVKEPKVYAMMIAYAPREAYLWGAATGAVPLTPPKKMKLLQVLSKARIQPSVADFRSIEIVRNIDGKEFTIPVNLQDVIAKKRYDSNIEIKADDVIIIPSFEDRAMMSYVYVLGKVNKPGRYGFIQGREKMKFTSLIAMAGDFHQYADEGRVRILRQRKSGTQLIKLDFGDIIDQKIEDPELQADDLVYVPESFF